MDAHYCAACGYGGSELAAGKGWHIVQRGAINGPLSLTELRDLHGESILKRDTMVWRRGQEDWKPAESTELLDLFFDATAQFRPPQVPPEAIDNQVVWILAFAPIIGMFVATPLEIALDLGMGALWWVYLLINIMLAVGDERRLSAGGWDTSGWGFWAIVLVPVYMFVRARRLRQSNTYAWVWVAMFFVSIVIEEVLFY